MNMMLFMLLGLPLLYLLENNDRLDAARIYALRHVILVSLGASLVAAGLRIIFDSFFPLDYFWFQSILWFLVADWFVPASVVIGVFLLLRKKIALPGPGTGLQILQTAFVLVFWVCLLVRLAARLNQLEYQDIFMYPGLLFVLMALLPVLVRLVAEKKLPSMAVVAICTLYIFAGIAIQVLSHMNCGIPALILLGLFAIAVLFFRIPLGARMIFPETTANPSRNIGS